MGAPKPGSTFQPTPAQGGKGGGKPMQPQQPGQVPAQGGKGAVQPPGTYPGMPLTPNPSSPYYFPNGPEPSAQALNQGKGQGVPMGGMLGGGGNPMQPQVQQLAPGQVPAQGGKGTSRQDYDRMMAQVSFAPGTTPPTYEQFVQQRTAPQMPQVMPMKPQQSPYGPYYDANGRPTAVGTGGPGVSMQPQVMPMKPGTPAPGLNGVPGNQNPLYFGPGKPAPSPAQVMPRPVPQVMPAQSRPTNMAPQQGLGGLAGLNGVPGNQNPLYFGPGRK